LEVPSVHIYIPKTNGKPDLKKRWYVYFYYYENGKRRQYKKDKGINKFKTIRERKRAANLLKRVIEDFLAQGVMPFQQLEKNLTLFEAVEYAYNEKRKGWSLTSQRSAGAYYNNFINWLDKNDMLNISVKKLKKQHLIIYLGELQGKMSNVSVNNNRRFLHNIFKKLSQDAIIDYNIMADLPNLKESPKKNKVFSESQLIQIQKYLEKTDPVLYKYTQFMIYTFLRPVEIVRIKVGDINCEKGIIHVKTKTGEEIIPIINSLKPLIKEMGLENYNKDDLAFTNLGVPYAWDLETREESRSIFFKKRFRKIKKHFNLGPEYGLYSFRHTFAKMLYNKFLTDGLTDLQAKHKLMTITRHKSLSSLNKYLRGIGAFVPDDYSDDFTFNF